MNKIVLGLALISLSFWSCQKPSRRRHQKIDDSVPGVSMISSQNPVEVHIDLNSDCLPYDSLMTKINYVKLETTGDNLIGEISQILFVNDKIVVVDTWKSKTIMVYDMKGHYLNQIGSLGQGSEEYAFFTHVSLTQDKKMIVVTDMGSTSLKYYSIDGRFIQSVKSPYWFTTTEFVTGNLIAGYDSGGNVLSDENEDYKPFLIVTDLLGNVSSSAFQSYYRKEYMSTVMEPLRKFEDRVLYNNPHTDSIYLLTPNGIELAYHLNIKGSKPIVVVDARPDIVLAYKNELYKLGKKEEIDEFYKDLTEDSNPVLFFTS